MISTALKQLIDEIYRQLDIAIETHQSCDLYKSMEGRQHGDGIAVNRFSINRVSYDDFIINVYIDRDYFFRKVMQGSYGPVDPLSHEILERNSVMGHPVALTHRRCGEIEQPPYKMFITMKGEE